MSASSADVSAGPAVILPAGPLRRLGAMLYDAFLIAAVFMLATVPFLSFMEDRSGLRGPFLYVHRVWLLSLFTVFFGYFWTRKGRTLGMQAWRLRIETMDGALPTWRHSLSRLGLASVPWIPGYLVLSVAVSFSLDYLRGPAIALFVLGPINYLVAYFDPRRRAWHERFLQTRIVRL